jgi:hypothetical protein
MVKFQINCFDTSDKKLKLTKDSILQVTVKPYTTPLASSMEFESWFFAGTNFDFFDGVQAQQFFFRTNNILHVARNSYVQFAIYKNRYFTSDSTTRNNLFQRENDFPIRDSMYLFTEGTYRKVTRQTYDPLGLQIDYLYKLSALSTSTDDFSKTIFLTGGFDVSTITRTIENTFSNFDTVKFRTKNRDTTINGLRSSPLPPDKYSYKTKASNINLGFMYIYNNKNINFKAHFTAGLSYYNDATVYVNTRIGNLVYYDNYSDFYIQLRTFGTYKPLGISIGFDAFYKSGGFLAINTTLSKVFDLENFTRILSPVNALGVK